MSSPAVQPRIRVPRIAQEAVDKARLSVVPRVRSRAPRVPFVTLVSLVLVSGVVGLLLFNTSMQQASFAASSLESQADNLAAREQTLRMELDELRNPQRVALQAQQMGMVIPPAPVFLDLETGDDERRPRAGHPGERDPAAAAGTGQARDPRPRADHRRGAGRATTPETTTAPGAPNIQEHAEEEEQEPAVTTARPRGRTPFAS